MRRSFLVRASEEEDNALIQAINDSIKNIQEHDPEWKNLVAQTARKLREYMLKAEPEFAGEVDFEQGISAAFVDDFFHELFPGYKEEDLNL